MFSSNQVSIRDLFSSHTRRYKTEPCDPAPESNSQSLSQLAFSQVENDVGSQYSSQSSDSLGKKFYGLYNNHKASLFNKDSQSKVSNLNPQPGKVSYHQLMQNNKAKAKERDERDLMENVVTFMRECSAEIKMAVNIVKENVQTGISTTQDNLTTHLEKLQEDLSKHRQDMIEVLLVRDDMKNKVSQLEQMITVKDARIEELEKSIEEYKNCENKDIIQELQRTVRDECEVTKDHITQTYEAHKKELDDIAQGQSISKQEILQQTKHMQRNIMDQSFGLMQEVQNKMQEDFERQQQSENRARQRLRDELQRELSHTQTQQREEVKALLRQQLQQIDSITDQRQADVFKQQQREMEELQNKHKDGLNKTLRQQLCSLSSEQKKFAEALIQEMWEKERLQAQTVLTEQHKSLKEEMHQSFEKELRNLKQRHIKEVNTILSKQKEDMEKNDQSQKSNRMWDSNSTCNVGSQDRLSAFSVENMDRSKYQIKNNPPLDAKSSLQVTSLFRSPLLANSKNWMSKNLFSKRNPSPVATVHPLVQQTEVTSHYSSSCDPCTRSSQVTTSDTGVRSMADQKLEQKPSQTKRKPHKRRRKSKFTKKKKTKKLVNSQTVEDTQELNRELAETEEDEEDKSSYISNRFDTVQRYNSQPCDKILLTQQTSTSALWMKNSLNTSTKDKMNIYDFHEEGVSEAKSNTTPGDTKWYAAVNTQVSNQHSSLSQMRMSKIMKSPELSQVGEGCSSVGSSPAYSVVDFMNMLKNKEDNKQSEIPFTTD